MAETPRARAQANACLIVRGAVGNATFNKRFKEIVRDLSDTELGYILGVSADAARKMRNGDIKSLKLEAALRPTPRLQESWRTLALGGKYARGELGVGSANPLVRAQGSHRGAC